MRVIEVDGATGWIGHTNYEGKAKGVPWTHYAKSIWFYVHVESPDEAGSRRVAQGKSAGDRRFRTQKVVGPDS